MSQPRSHQVIDIQSETEGQDAAASLNHHSHRLSSSSDTSASLFSLYLRTAEEQDGRRFEFLKAETNQIVVFCGLFSAAVASLVYSGAFSVLPADGYPFFLWLPNTLAQAVWLLSMIIGLTCAQMAISLQRCARPREEIASPCYSLHEKARMHAFFAAGGETLDFTCFVEKLHLFAHVSVLLFFVGTIIHMTSVTNLVFIAAVAWIIFSQAMYLRFTFMPSTHPGRPYSTPLSQFATRMRARVLYRFLCWVISLDWVSNATREALNRSKDRYHALRDWTMMKFAEEKAREPSREIDGHLLTRTLDRIRDDHDLEQFFEAIPGFCDSKLVDDPQGSLDILGHQRLTEALAGFWNRTLSSNLVPVSVKGRRLVLCIRVIKATKLSIAVPWIPQLLFVDPGEVLRSVEIGHSLGTLRNGSGASLARGIIASIISNAERNDRWFALATDELCISRDVLCGYLAHADSVLLANLIHITGHFYHSLLQPDSGLTRKSLSILSSLSKFDILNTLPQLQRDFCNLWNKVVQRARNSIGADDNPFVDILVEIRCLYVDLHGTDIALGYFFASSTGYEDLFHQAASYPLCMMPDHHPMSAIPTQETSCSAIGGAGQTITTASPVPILFESSPGDVSHTTATGMGATRGVTETCIPSVAESVTRSPSSTGGDQTPDEGITRQEFSSSTPMDALLPSNPEVPTVSAPDIASGTAFPSATTRRENEGGQGMDPTIPT